MGVVGMPPLPPVSPEDVQNSRVPSPHGHYPASSLLRTRPPPSRRRTSSRDHRLYARPDSADFAAGRGGFRQLLDAPVSPCCRSKPRRSAAPRQPACAGPRCSRGGLDRAASPPARPRRPVLPSRGNPPLGLQGSDLSGPPHVHLRYGPVTRSPSLRWLCRIER